MHPHSFESLPPAARSWSWCGWNRGRKGCPPWTQLQPHGVCAVPALQRVDKKRPQRRLPHERKLASSRQSHAPLPCRRRRRPATPPPPPHRHPAHHLLRGMAFGSLTTLGSAQGPHLHPRRPHSGTAAVTRGVSTECSRVAAKVMRYDSPCVHPWIISPRRVTSAAGASTCSISLANWCTQSTPRAAAMVLGTQFDGAMALCGSESLTCQEQQQQQQHTRTQLDHVLAALVATRATYTARECATAPRTVSAFKSKMTRPMAALAPRDKQ